MGLSNSNIKLYAPFSGANNAVSAKDYSNSAHTLTFNGGAKISIAQSYYNGGSALLLDGSGDDYVEVAYASDFNMGTPFTIKCKFMATTISVIQEIICQIALANATGGFAIYVNGSNKICVACSTSGSSWELNSAGNTTIVANKWYDIVFVKTSTDAILYVDGIMDSTWALAGSLYQVDPIRIGLYTTGFPYAFYGYIQDIMIIKGEAWNNHKFYNATLDAKSSYLKAGWKFGEYGVYDCVGTNHLTNSGVTFADVGMQGYKCGTWDGNNSRRLQIADNANFQFGTGDFSINAWVYYISESGARPVCGKAYSGSSGINNWVLRVSDGYLQFVIRDGVSVTEATSSSGAFPTNSWHMVTFVRNGSNMKLYCDANNDGSESISLAATNNQDLLIGMQNLSEVTAVWHGNIQELRIYKGAALTQAEISLLYNSGKAKLLMLERRQHALRFGNDYLDSYSKFLVAGWKLDEMSGTRYDSVGFNNGTDTGTIGNVLDNTFGKVASFTSEQYLSFGTGVDIADHPLTINMWINPTNHTHQGQLITSPSGQQGYTAALTNAAKISFGKNGVDEVVSTDAVPDGEWSMITIVYSIDNKITFYKNASADSGGQLAYTTAFAVGGGHRFGWQGVTDYNYLGLACNISIWNEALDSTAITALYNAGVSRQLTYDYTINRQYPMDNVIEVWPMQETSGNRIGAKNSYVATNNNSVGYTSGHTRDYCSTFNGTDQSLEIAQSEYDFASLFASCNFSILFWIKPETGSGSEQQMIINCYDNINNTHGIMIYYSTANISAELFYDGTGWGPISSFDCFDDNWHRIAVVVKNETASIYIDGTLDCIGIDSRGIGNSNAPLLIGDNPLNPEYLNGSLQELTFLDIAVDESFITKDYNEGTGRFYPIP